MINKIYGERAFMYAPIMTITFSVKISGRPNINDIKQAINFAVNRFEILRCRILQDSNGQAYYVLRENRCIPKVEVRHYHLDMQEFLNEQEKIPFRFDEGEMIRFYIEKMQHVVYLKIASHHLAGDGNSLLILINEILENLKEINEGTFSFEDKEMIPLKSYDRKYLEERVGVNELVRCTMEAFNEKWKEEKVIFTYEDYVKMHQKFWSNYSSKVKSVSINKDTLNEIKQLSREHGVSVNSTIVTVVSKVMKELKKMSIVVDTRPSDYTGMGNFAGSLLIESIYDNKKDFWENTKYINNQIHSQLNDRIKTMFGIVFKSLLEDNFQDALTFSATDNVSCQLAEDYDNTYGFGKNRFPFVISNLGANKLKNSYGRFKVEEVALTSPKIVGIDCNVAVITVNDIMTMTMEYYEGAEIDYSELLENILCEIQHLMPESEEYLEFA